MAGSRLFAQFSLVGVTLVLIIIGFYSMRFQRYFYAHPPLISIKNLTLDDWQNFLPSPIDSVQILKENLIFSGEEVIKVSQEAKANVFKDHGVYHISILSVENNKSLRSVLYDTRSEVFNVEIGNSSINEIVTDFWRYVTKSLEDISQIPPSREIHLQLILGAESEEISSETVSNARRIAFQIKEYLKYFHDDISVSLSFRIMRNLNWKSFLSRHEAGNISCSILFADDISGPHSSPKFPISRITSTGITGVKEDVSCDYSTQLCSQYTLLLYAPETTYQPLLISQSREQKKSNFCSSPPLLSSVVFPASHVGLIPYNDLNRSSTSQLTSHLLSLLNSALNPNVNYPLGSLMTSIWSRRILLISWTSHLYADTQHKLEIIYSLHTNSGHMDLSIPAGNYFSLNDSNMKKYLAIVEKLHFMEACSTMHKFDERLTCAFQLVSQGNLLARDLLHDPEMIDQRKEGIEMISAILLPFWFPVLIPLLYGTYHEIRRYSSKRKARRD